MHDNRFDCMKGMAITGVVAGHLGYAGLEVFVNYWHLPVFFFVSGYFFKEKHIDNSRSFVIARFRRLIVPFLLYSVCALFLHNILVYSGLIDGREFQARDYITELRGIFLCLSSNEEIVGAIWFMPGLFVVTVCALYSFKLANHCRIRNYELGGVVASLVAVLMVVLRIPSPLSLWQNMAVMILFVFGYICSRHGLMRYLTGHVSFLIAASIVAVAFASGVKAGCQSNMINNVSLYYFPIFVSGIIMACYISHHMAGNRLGKLFSYIGKFSFSIMIFHFVAFKAVTALHHYLVDESVRLCSFPTSETDLALWTPVYLLAGIGMPVVLSSLFNKMRYAWSCHSGLQKA